MTSSPTSSPEPPTYLTLSHVRDMVHAYVQLNLAEYEPMPAWAEVDLGKLEAALAAPRQGGFGVGDFYPGMADKAAILLYSITKGHAWTNGNKRMGTISTLLFLGINGLWWEAENEEIRSHVAWVAASEARCFDEVTTYLQRYFRLRIVAFENRTEAHIDDDEPPRTEAA